MSSRFAGALAGALLLLAAAATARASGGPEELTFRAGKVEAGADLLKIELKDDVVITFGRARIESQALRLERRPDGGAVVEGEARLWFCPCPDPPIAIAFAGGEAFPEGDITLRFPRLEVLGLPVFALPWIWVRAPHQIGLLPPFVAWRGASGLLAGTGVHVPWMGEGGAPRVFEATTAGYFTKGGVEVGARLETPSTTTRATFDWLRRARVELSAQGHFPARGGASDEGLGAGGLSDAGAAWDIDAIRGDSARARTLSLEAAAKPFDAMAAETSLRIGRASVTGFLSTGVIARAYRGDGRVAGGPSATFALGGPLSSRGAWDALLTGAVLRDDQTDAAVALALASVGTELNFHPGPLEVRVSSRERVRAASRATDPSADAAASARLDVGLPLARSFGNQPGDAPLVHIIEPSLEAQGAIALGRGTFFREHWDAAPRFLWTSAAAISTSLGTYTGSGARIALRAGFAGLNKTIPRPAAHALAAAQTPWLSGDLEAALVPPGSPTDPGPFNPSSGEPLPISYALLARARAGPPGGIELRADLAAMSGAEASLARIFAGGTASGPYAAELLYLAEDGISGAASLAIPWTQWLRTSARAAADFTAERLLAVGLGVELKHPCGCASLTALGAYRAGRDGIDAIISLDIGIGASTPERARRAEPPPPSPSN